MTDKIIRFGKENLEWIVLEEKGSSSLIILKDCISVMKWTGNGSYYGYCPWNSSDIYFYLNDDFVDEFIGDQSQKAIRYTKTYEVSGKKETLLDYSYPSEDDFSHKVFLLSDAEVNKYFPEDKRAAFLHGTEEKVPWWCRDSFWDFDDHETMAIMVETDGTLSGTYAYSKAGIRPAMWISTQDIR